MGLCMSCVPCMYTIPNDQYGIVETFGKFQYTPGPGLHFINCFTSNVRGRISTRVKELDISCQTKTLNNVFVNVVVSIQYEVIPEQVREAFYRLQNEQEQIRSYVFDVVRSNVPTMELDEVFTNKDNIARQVRQDLGEKMSEYGFRILDALVTDIDPNKAVKDAMNDIEASKRLREAALEKAEAEKILKVKEAEADAESKFLSGQGIARQRQAIVAGLQESVSTFSESIGVTPEEVMNLILLTQYFDTLNAVAANSQSNTILIPHSPGTVKDLGDQARLAFLGQRAAAASGLEM